MFKSKKYAIAKELLNKIPVYTHLYTYMDTPLTL